MKRKFFVVMSYFGDHEEISASNEVFSTVEEAEKHIEILYAFYLQFLTKIPDFYFEVHQLTSRTLIKEYVKLKEIAR